MALKFFTGWDSLTSTTSANIIAELNAKGVFALAGSGSFSRIAGRNGIGFALRYNGTSRVTFVENVAYASGAAGMISSATPGNTSQAALVLRDANGIDLTLRYAADNTNSVALNYNPAGTGNDISQSFTVPPGIAVFNCFEIRWTSSLIELALNNQVIYTKAQTAQPAFTNFAVFGSTTPTIDLDDVYVADDANFRGDFYCRQLALVSTASNTGTVVGAANAHSALSSIDGDTSYIDYTADSQKTLLEVADITDNPTTVHGVCLARQGRKSDTGSVTESLLINTASENTVGGAFAGLSLAHSGRRVVTDSDPADTLAWTKAKVNGMQVGIKRGV